MNYFIKISSIIIVTLIPILAIVTSYKYFQDSSDPIVNDSNVITREDSDQVVTPISEVSLIPGVTVKDFLNDGETKADPMNPGNYIVYGGTGYCIEELCDEDHGNTFLIEYDSQIRHFSVLIIREPVKDVRKNVQSVLSEKLGVSQQDLCKLNYSVYVPYWVTEDYSGVDIRFEGCQDALRL